MYFWGPEHIEEIRRSLPIIFTRETACKLLGGIFTPKTLSNFDAAGNGPRTKQHIGRKVAYNRDDFIEWLEGMFAYPVKDIGNVKKDSGKAKCNPYWQ